MTRQEKQEIFFKSLVIEDEDMHQKIMSHFLSQFHYTIEVVDTAEKAIQLIHTKIYDLILTDLGLPDQGGEMIVHQARMSDINWLTPLIVLTTHANAELQKNVLNLVLIRYFLSPYLKKF